MWRSAERCRSFICPKTLPAFNVARDLLLASAGGTDVDTSFGRITKQLPPGLASVKTILSFGKSQRRMSRRKSSRISSTENLLKDANFLEEFGFDTIGRAAFTEGADDLSNGLWNSRCGLLQGQGFGKLSIYALNLAAKRYGNPPEALPLCQKQGLVAKECARRKIYPRAATLAPDP